jgi:GNAT superfamily N-acetyltransferase
MGDISYGQEENLSAAEFVDLLERSGLDRHRPVHDHGRIERMLSNSNLVIGARQSGRLVGVARCITDFSWCCYISEVAVDATIQGHGIGKRLMQEVRRAAGCEATCLLLSYPDAAAFYEGIGMKRFADAFLFERQY